MEHLLTNTCTVTAKGGVSGTDEYNRPEYADVVASHDCLFNTAKDKRLVDEKGKDVEVVGQLFLKKTAAIEIGNIVTGITGPDGYVITGPFIVIEVKPSLAPYGLHHLSAYLRRAD